MLTRFILLVLINFVGSHKTSFDLTKCKLTHLGTEYVGREMQTESKIPCIFWNSPIQKKGSSGTIRDAAFPDGSKVLARNFCRNPTKLPRGPWCYTGKPNLIFDYCDVPLCQNSDCRITGTGMEYTGTIHKSVSGKKCTDWKMKHKMKDKHKETVFRDKNFADGSIFKAGKNCRNPSGDIAGPWCYVENNYDDFHTAELCDVPFCDDFGEVIYSKGSHHGHYYFFTTLNVTGSFNFSVRLWNPSDWLEAKILLYLGVYDISLNREDINRWNSGVELLISNNGSGILLKNEDTMTKTPNIISGAGWTDFRITWFNLDNTSILLQVFQKYKAKPIAIREIAITDSIFEYETFKYFSLGGTPTLWNFNSKEDDCFIHTSSQLNFTRFWLMKRTAMGMDVEIFVRAVKKATILFRRSPMNDTNAIQVVIGDEDKIKILAYTDAYHVRQIAEKIWPKILQFWKWEYFKISFLKEKIQIFWIRSTSTDLLLDVSHGFVENLMWVSFASPRVSHWTIYCDPRGVSDPPKPIPPECVTQENETFNGSMSVTREGKQCIPWTDVFSLPKKFQSNKLFEPYGGKANCQNFCRNLNHDPSGAFCFVRNKSNKTRFILEHCHPRICSFGDCKLAGTANDYIGTLNKTRSKRTCRTWTDIDDKTLIDVKNFPDPNIQDSKNYCRNPSKSPTGAWCFTTDPLVERDLCYIPDCDKPLECTVLIAGFSMQTFMFIQPKWRKNGLSFWLKAWNPDIYDGLIVSMKSLDREKEYELLIGADENEKVLLYYKSFNKDILMEYKTLPHLIPVGKWGGYWLRSGLGKIELGYSGVKNAFFEWSTTDSEIAFEPMFINFGTIKAHWIAINFKCTECIVEETSDVTSNKIYPINLWKEEFYTNHIRLNLRGTGVANIILMWSPEFEKYLGVQIYGSRPNIVIVRYSGNNTDEVLSTFPVVNSIRRNVWSEYIISYTEKSLTIHKDGKHLLVWASPFPLLFYWFSVVAQEGKIIWSANCPPADVSETPRDGNWGRWSPWTCSVSCGGGEGRIQRLCNNPPPNIFGKECPGTEVFEGHCNDFPCGEISPRTNDIIREYLSTQFKSIKAKPKERVILSCNSETMNLITTEVTEMNITWTHNGFPITKTKFHMDRNYSLIISHTQEKHNGVYLCIAYQDPDSIPSKVVLDVVSLVVVKPKAMKKIRKGRSMQLKCNGLALSYVYADLIQRWELNGTVWKDYGLGNLEMYTVDKLENITDLHAGIWTCVIVQEDLGFRWTTNWVRLKVKSAPSFWSNLMEDVATAPLFGKLGSETNAKILFFSLLGFLTVVVVVISLTIVRFFWK